MAFRNAGVANVGTSFTNLYVGTASKETVIHAVYLSNNHATDTVYANVRVNVGGGVTAIDLIENAVILPGTALVFDKPINLMASDSLQVRASTANVVDAFASALVVDAS